MTQARVVLDEDDVRRTLVRIAHEIVEKNAGRPVAHVLGPLGRPPLLVLELRAAPQIEKAVQGEIPVERVTVDGAPGLWLEGPRHEFFYRTLEREAMRDTQRLAGNTLLWTRGPLTLRIEGDLSKAEAIRIAESMGT